MVILDVLSPFSPEHYNHQFAAQITQAQLWLNGENTRQIVIQEPNLEAYLQKYLASVDFADQSDLIYSWNNPHESETLLVICNQETSHRTYILDSDDLIIGRPSDTFYFYRVETCWAVVIDYQTQGHSYRLGYHLPGTTLNKPVCLRELFNVLGTDTHFSKVSIFYNSLQYPKSIEGQLQELNKGLPTAIQTYDMNQFDDRHIHDLYVTGDKATQHHNQAIVSDSPDSTDRVQRVQTGTWLLRDFDTTQKVN